MNQEKRFAIVATLLYVALIVGTGFIFPRVLKKGLEKSINEGVKQGFRNAERDSELQNRTANAANSQGGFIPSSAVTSALPKGNVKSCEDFEDGMLRFDCDSVCGANGFAAQRIIAQNGTPTEVREFVSICPQSWSQKVVDFCVGINFITARGFYECAAQRNVGVDVTLVKVVKKKST